MSIINHEQPEYWVRRKREDDEGYPSKRFNSNNSDSQYQRDRARIIHSAAFRRLQAKTQILGIGESDFYRTRLTHSLEVAQIGSGISEFLHEKYNCCDDISKWLPSLSLIETIGLSHDLGHPPFGHGGEVALNYAMINEGGFEGNGQTLRIITKLGEYSPSNGMDLTRRSILGILKYPSPYSKTHNYKKVISSTQQPPINLDNYHPPKCYLDDETHDIDWIFQSIPLHDRLTFTDIKKNEDKHHKTKYKAFDTSIMELADDISYGVHDLEDGIAIGLITKDMWIDEVASKIGMYKENKVAMDIDFYTGKLFSGSNKDRKHAISKLIGHFISSISIKKNKLFETQLLDLCVTLPDDSKIILDLLKSLVMTRVIKTPEVQVLEYKGQQIVLKLFEVLKSNPERLLPRSTFDKYVNAENKERVICDYISGMTDNYATKLYHKLFTPSNGSIFDKL
ncbi:anti-phage deoxyguanosine triphosphatase [Aeromonas veronii]|uniref:anti-phage deoxyguanosine triphosphatase n=1 Tax=Aeromonas veronii TaxID=654 RepID=UPI001E3BF916|nr:anti-phage deoxyguanosine triphosphatase [Aeromonas veronii]MCD6616193.1 deoxyguanosinetriphosphate triphosphohydrolase family protein [Aeromonas veronii]MCS0538568.1 anti-phage deoxyguanosine triphosphatase [Aeromonas veronii]